MPLGQYADQVFTGQEVLLDGHTFRRCEFRRCVLRFHGTAGTQLTECRTDDECQWFFNGQAAFTLDFLQALLLQEDEGARQAVLHLFDDLRSGQWAPKSPP